MARDSSSEAADGFRLVRAIDPDRDHIRGGGVPEPVTVVAYADLLCPYCQRLRQVMLRLRDALGRRIVYVFRHFPNERAHPGAERLARATEAADQQGRFWDFYDWIYGRQTPISDAELFDFARSLGLDMARFEADLEGDEARHRVEEDMADGRRNGVTGTPTLFVDGVRYDGAWDFYSMLEEVERPVAARVHRSARVFASLPASGGIVLLLAAAAALVCANTGLRHAYEALMGMELSFGPRGALSLTVAEWCSEGLLAFFFLLVGLEIRRETTAGALSDRKAAALPIICAVGGVLAPAAIYLTLNRGPSAAGWSIPTATDIAFTLGILAVLGDRIPPTLRVFVAALAVADDILSVLTLAIFYPQSFHLPWLLASGLAIALLFTLNRWRAYALWPYAFVTAFLWIALHLAGVHAALSGVILAVFLPTRPAPAAAPLLAQAATALAALEHAESEAKVAGRERPLLQEDPVWDWASRNLSAASERLLSVADRIELAVAPWSNYVVLPLFAFSATGVALAIDLSQPDAHRILAGILLGLVVGKPLGVSLGAWLGVKAKIASMPDGVTLRQFFGAACLCGVADTVALLLADRAFPSGVSALAKIGVLVASAVAALLGTLVLATGSYGVARSPAPAT